jgi:carbamate kinase
VEKNNYETNQSDSPIRIFSSPSYIEIIKKKPLENFGSSEDESFERPTKRAGRKYHKEEAERQKMKASQSTIEMSIGINNRTSPPREVQPTPTLVNNAYSLLEL